MTIRAALEDLMAGRGQGLDPAAVLEGYGFDDLSPDALSTALGHFAESSPLDIADALAPIVSRLSDVPFAEGDLAPSAEAEAILGDGGGILDLLADLEIPGSDDLNPDPTDFDAVEDFTDTLDAVATGDGSLDDVADELGAGFGLGDDDLEALADQLDLSEVDDVEVGVDDLPELDEPVFDESTASNLLGQLAEQVDLPEDLDPDDLDFDLD